MRSTIRFTGHYLEMLLVMLAGMLVIGGVLVLAATALGSGYSELRQDAPAAVLIGMGFSMTAPMVWWMRRRGHSTAANWDMAMAMVLPTLVTVLLLASGAVTDIHTLLMTQHVAMFPAMLVAMLMRRDEYTGSPAPTTEGVSA